MLLTQGSSAMQVNGCLMYVFNIQGFITHIVVYRCVCSCAFILFVARRLQLAFVTFDITWGPESAPAVNTACLTCVCKFRPSLREGREEMAWIKDC
jgi:hypothetical protein